MRLNPNFRIHKIGRLYMIVDTDADNANLARVYSLNAVAGWLWLRAEGKDFSVAGLAELLCEEYDVEPSRALSDAAGLVGLWQKFGFIIP